MTLVRAILPRSLTGEFLRRKVIGAATLVRPRWPWQDLFCEILRCTENCAGRRQANGRKARLNRPTTLADRRTTTADRQTTMPGRRTTLPHRQTTTADRRTTTSDRQTTMPDRRTTVPHRQTTVPHRQTTVAYRRTTLANRRTTLADRRTMLADRWAILPDRWTMPPDPRAICHRPRTICQRRGAICQRFCLLQACRGLIRAPFPASRPLPVHEVITDEQARGRAAKNGAVRLRNPAGRQIAILSDDAADRAGSPDRSRGYASDSVEIGAGNRPPLLLRGRHHIRRSSSRP